MASAFCPTCKRDMPTSPMGRCPVCGAEISTRVVEHRAGRYYSKRRAVTALFVLGGLTVAGLGVAVGTTGFRLGYVLVLAGLGGLTIVRILSDPRRDTLGVRRLVLQPATDAAAVRRWLASQGLATMDERLAGMRGRYHVVIAAERGSGPELAADLDAEALMEAGPALLARRDPALLPYWRATLERQRAILREASPGVGRREALRLQGVAERVLAMLEAVS